MRRVISTLRPGTALREIVLAATVLLLPVGLTACGHSGASASHPPADRQLVVFAAASLTEAFTQVGEAFEAANPGVRVVFNFAGSQQLRAQLEEGARADVFASANETQMRAAQAAGLLAERPQTFAHNRLVVIVPADNPGQVWRPVDLTRPGLRLVLAHPDVPVGGYTRQALTKMSADPELGTDFRERVLANLVSSEESVKQVVAKVELGEADMGIVYASDVAPRLGRRVVVIPIPPQHNVTASYPAAVLRMAADLDMARRFVEFLLSAQAQRILEDYGFIPLE